MVHDVVKQKQARKKNKRQAQIMKQIPPNSEQCKNISPFNKLKYYLKLYHMEMH